MISKSCSGGWWSRDRPRCAEVRPALRALLLRAGVSPFTVGRSPSTRRKTAGECRRRAQRGKPCVGCYRLGTVNGETWAEFELGRSAFFKWAEALASGYRVAVAREPSRDLGFKSRIYVKRICREKNEPETLMRRGFALNDV